jgi:hypothetical protein
MVHHIADSSMLMIKLSTAPFIARKISLQSVQIRKMHRLGKNTTTRREVMPCKERHETIDKKK